MNPHRGSRKPPGMIIRGLKKVPSQVQLPGGIILRGCPFKILDYNADGSPKTFEILPPGSSTAGPNLCTLFAHEAWIRGAVKS